MESVCVFGFVYFIEIETSDIRWSDVRRLLSFFHRRKIAGSRELGAWSGAGGGFAKVIEKNGNL